MLLREFLKDRTLIYDMSRNCNHAHRKMPHLDPNLDDILIMKHGFKTVVDSVLGVDYDKLPCILAEAYRETWRAYFHIEEMLGFSYGHDKSITETITDAGEVVSERSTVDKIGAFDSDSLVVDSSNEVNSEDGNSNTRTRTYHETYNNLYDSLKSADTYSERGIILRIVSDVADFLTVGIY